MRKQESMIYIINRAIKYDESFMVNIRGDPWRNISRFINLMSKRNGSDTRILPAGDLDDDLMPFLRRNSFPVINDINESKNALILARSPWEAFRHSYFNNVCPFVMLLNDIHMKKEWHDAMKEFLFKEMTHRLVRIVFFSPDDDSFNRPLSYLNMKQAIKIQNLTERKIGIFGNMVWKEEDNDFVMLSEKEQDIESMFGQFKEGIEDLADLVNGMDKVRG